MATLTVAEILSGTALGLTSGLDDLLVSEIGGRRVLYALNRAESRLVEIEVQGSGALSVSGSLVFTGAFSAGSNPQLTQGSFSSGTEFLAIAGLAPSDGQIITLSAVGNLVAQQTLSGVGQLSAPIGLEVSGTPVIVSSTSGGLLHYADGGAEFESGTGVSDASDRYLADVVTATSFSDGSTTFIVTASATENGINIVSVTASGLTQIGALGNAEGLPISAPSDIAAVNRLGETLLLISSSGTSSVSVVLVEDGLPSMADHVLDNAETRFQGATSVSAITFNDFVFSVAAGAEGGVSLFTVLPGGRLIHLDSVSEDETVPLDQVASLATEVFNSTLNVFVGSSSEVGLTRMEFDLSSVGQVVQASSGGAGANGTADDDQIIGSVASESLDGLAGDDILLDGHGTDTLTGGTGADLFVFTADGVIDEVTDFERGIDQLDLSAFDFLYDVSQLTITPTANGATLAFGAETILVTTADAAPLTSAGLGTVDILNVDRPPFLLIGREIVGTSASEVLTGGPGDDTIAAAGGDDSVGGGYGLDMLLGSTGQDTLNGQGDRDTLVGGVGDDLLNGGDGGDLIYGDDWS